MSSRLALTDLRRTKVCLMAGGFALHHLFPGLHRHEHDQGRLQGLLPFLGPHRGVIMKKKKKRRTDEAVRIDSTIILGRVSAIIW